MKCKVHFAEIACIVGFLLTVNAQLASRIFCMLADKVRRLHEHTSRSAGRIEDHSVEWLDHSDDEFNDGFRCEELSAFASLYSCKCPKKIFIDLSEEIAGRRREHGAE